MKWNINLSQSGGSTSSSKDIVFNGCVLNFSPRSNLGMKENWFLNEIFRFNIWEMFLFAFLHKFRAGHTIHNINSKRLLLKLYRHENIKLCPALNLCKNAKRNISQMLKRKISFKNQFSFMPRLDLTRQLFFEPLRKENVRNRFIPSRCAGAGDYGTHRTPLSRECAQIQASAFTTDI
jgi:hypothetical protein